jgi:hypothetical protein
MKANTKAKWIVGITGTAFSAFIISQLDQSLSTETEPNTVMLATEITESMSSREKELIQLDWSDFSIQANNGEANVANDRTSRRSR